LGGPAGPPEPLGFLASALGSGKGEGPGDAGGGAGRGPGCPFGGMVAAMGSEARREGDGTPDGPVWTDEAAERLNRIPGFVRGMAKKGIEQFARERGYPRITGAVMDEARGALGM
ncbi:MAG TPA: PCP reductase family protein, partial [Candidatus Methylomirabilis sp.]|nr:PCP reductase family protein [Candidatus Methylomirabilis sp.]